MAVRPDDLLTGELLRVYRTLPARVIGWLLVAAAFALGALTVADVMQGRESAPLTPLALGVWLGAIGFVLFLRPRAVLREDGVELVNILSTTTVPFGAVADVTHQWALELHDHEGVRHSSWAVPVRREMVRRKAIDDFAETTRHRGSEGVTAQGAADAVQRVWQRWRLDGGGVTAPAGGAGSGGAASGGAGATAVVKRGSPSAVGALALAVVVTLLALVL